jgi:hypothetical protein
MSDKITADEILMLINERDKHTQDKLVDILETQKETARTLEKVCNHIIVSEEDKRHDAEFKRQVREHIKFATPILYKSRDFHAVKTKVIVGAISFLLFGILGAFFKFS